MKIFFIEGSKIQFDAFDRYDNKLRGGETVLINLAEQLSKLNHEVHVFNNCNHNNKLINGVYWTNIDILKNKKINNICDVSVVQADANLLNFIKSDKKFIISHSIQKFEKFLRKKQLIPFIKHKPIVITASAYHFKNRSYLTSFGGKVRMFWSVDEMFFKTPINDDLVKNKAIFTTRPDRNLNLLISIWNKFIYPNSKNSYLYINPPYKVSSNDYNIKLRTLGNQKKLLDDLKSSRAMLIPGHKSEIFCLAAQEAQEMCIPIVTLGYGALAERVEHNETGFLAKNVSEFAKYSTLILNDDEVWNKMRSNLLKKRGKITWQQAAIKFNSFL